MVETRQCYRAVYPKSQSLYMPSCNTAEESRWLYVSKSRFFVLAATPARKDVLESGGRGVHGTCQIPRPVPVRLAAVSLRTAPTTARPV
jgi:hypothetical protein